MIGLDVVGVPAGPSTLTFSADPGTSVALLTTESSRATAALGVIAGLARTGSGRALLDGRPVTARDVGVMQRPARLLPELTARENVCLPLLARGLPVDGTAIDQCLIALALDPNAFGNLVEQLSGGQQQRVAIARALITRPPLLCLDEPVTELDDDTVDTVWTAIRAATRPDGIAVVATTDASLAARCDRVVTI